MRGVIFAGATCILAALTVGCTEPSVTGIPNVAATPAASRAPSAPAAGNFDGTWQIEMLQLSTTYGTTVGGECPVHHTAPRLTFVNGSAEGPWGKLSLSGDGAMSGWMIVPPVGTSMLPFIVNLSGDRGNGFFKGSVSGRCTGTFVMTKQ